MQFTKAAVWLLIAGCAVLSQAQSKPPETPTPKLVASLARSTYRVGEAVEVTASLENAGTQSFYIPKDFERGDVGFDFYLIRDGHPWCYVQAEVTCVGTKRKRQNTEELLNDHFLLLTRGAFIGLHGFLRTACMPSQVLPPGNYEVNVGYSALPGCTPDMSGRPTKFPVFNSKITAPRMQFEIVK